MCCCQHCIGDAPGWMTLEEAGCQYAETSARAAKLASKYRHFVEDGNVPLHECPQWMVEVGELIRSYRARQDAKRERDRKIDEHQRSVRNQLDAQT